MFSVPDDVILIEAPFRRKKIGSKRVNEILEKSVSNDRRWKCECVVIVESAAGAGEGGEAARDGSRSRRFFSEPRTVH
jgi:hypothetical protein